MMLCLLWTRHVMSVELTAQRRVGETSGDGCWLGAWPLGTMGRGVWVGGVWPFSWRKGDGGRDQLGALAYRMVRDEARELTTTQC